MALLKPKNKHTFDVNSKQDIEVFKRYFETGSWGPEGCPFELEDPFTNVPDMCKDKIVSKFLKV